MRITGAIAAKIKSNLGNVICWKSLSAPHNRKRIVITVTRNNLTGNCLSTDHL